MTAWHYSIAGYAFRLHTRVPGQELRLKPSFAPFRTDAVPGPWDGDYEIVEEADFPWPEPDPARTYLSSITWRFGHALDGRIYMDCAYVPNAFWQHAALLEPDFSRGVVFPKRLAPEQPAPYTLFFPIDEQLFLNRMALLGGALIHACGVAMDGRAVLFCGRSGAGKSTIARLCRAAGHILMNDDRIVVRPAEAAIRAGATPWHGTVAEIDPGVRPLGAVFHLRQAPENRVVPLSARQGTLRLMANAIAPFYRRDPVQAILDTLARAGDQARHYELHFRPDDGAVAAARAALG
jgi:hypothetical protein